MFLYSKDQFETFFIVLVLPAVDTILMQYILNLFVSTFSRESFELDPGLLQVLMRSLVR